MFRLCAVPFWFQTVKNCLGRYSKGKKHAGWKVEFGLWIYKLCCMNTRAVLCMSDQHTWMWSFLLWGNVLSPPMIVVIISGQPLAWKMQRSKVLSLPWTGSKRRVACSFKRVDFPTTKSGLTNPLPALRPAQTSLHWSSDRHFRHLTHFNQTLKRVLFSCLTILS